MMDFEIIPDLELERTKAEAKFNLLHYPGHNYLGPGTDYEDNVERNVKPVDYDDYVAMIHDQAYTEAKTRDDIREADEAMVQQLKLTTQLSNMPSVDHELLARLIIQGKIKLDDLLSYYGLPVYGEPTVEHEPLKTEDILLFR
jgi:hypothetical protein